MNKIMRRINAGILVAGCLVAVSEAGPVRAAFSYPSANSKFQQCLTDEQEYCVETLEFTPTGGAKQVIETPVVAEDQEGAGVTPHISVLFQGAYSGPSSVTLMNPVMLYVRVINPTGSLYTAPYDGRTLSGLADGKYRFVIRTGDFDPAIMMLKAKYENFTITKGTDDYYTLDVTATPVALAMVLNASQSDTSATTACEAGQWITNCEANLANRAEVMAHFMMHPQAQYRATMRNMWVASNASVLQMQTMDLATGTIGASAKGPHFVPDSFGDTTLVREGDRYLNPAYFEMGISLSLVASALSLITRETVTADQVKEFASNPAARSSMVEGKIKEIPDGASVPVDKTQAVTVSATDTSLRINFNLTHYSAPNPTVVLKKPTVAAAPATNTPTNTETKTPVAETPAASTPTVTTPAAAPATTTKKLSNGASLKILSSASKGTTYSAKSLLSPSAGSKIQGMKSTSPTVCSAKKTSVKMLKTGTCKLAVKILAKKKVASVPVKISVS